MYVKALIDGRMDKQFVGGLAQSRACGWESGASVGVGRAGIWRVGVRRISAGQAGVGSWARGSRVSGIRRA